MNYPVWPGFEGPPVYINAGRPGRNRPRLGTDYDGRGQRYYRGPNGEYLVPAGRPQRASSVSGMRPAQIVINNDQFNEDGAARPRSHSRPRSPYYEEDYETRRKLERLMELERKEEEEKREKQLKEKMLLEQAKKEREEREREEEEKELKKKAVEEWQKEEREKKEKEKKEKEEADKEFEERTRQMLWRNGYSESQIERIMKKDKEKDKDKEKKGKSVELIEGSSNETRIIALNRPTYIRVRRKHLDPETLDRYQLPWEWDEEDDDYIIIKKWVNERDQEILFEHTRNLREQKQLTYTTLELRKERDQMLLVRKKHDRKKSPAKSWFQT